MKDREINQSRGCDWNAWRPAACSRRSAFHSCHWRRSRQSPRWWATLIESVGGTLPRRPSRIRSRARSRRCANPIFMSDQLSAGLRDSSNVAVSPIASPIFMPEQLSARLSDPTYEQPVVAGQLSTLAPAHDFHPLVDMPNGTSLLRESAVDVPSRVTDSGSAVPTHHLPDSSPVVDLEPTTWQGDETTSIDGINAGSVAPNLENSTMNLSFSYGLAGETSALTTSTIHDLPPRFAGDVTMGDPSAFDPVVLSHGMNEVPFDIQTLPQGRGPDGFRLFLNGAADRQVPAIVVAVENVVSAGVESFVPPVTFATPVTFASPATIATPVKSHSPELLPASDPSRVEVQALASAEASASTPSGVVNSLVTNAAFTDAAPSNPLEDGFLALDNASVAAPQLGNSPSYNTGFQGVGVAGLDHGNWLTNVLPNTRKPADSTGSNSKAAPTGGNLAAEFSSQPAAVILQPIDDSEEGGSIELAIAAPSSAAVSGDALSGGVPTVGAAQQLSEILPESGVGLFCDIEVAAVPILPIDGSASTATTSQSDGSFVADTGSRGWNAHTVTEFVPRSTKSSQPTLAGLADSLPLLFGMTVLVSRSGLRLEEEVSERERHLCSAKTASVPFA